MTLFCAQPLNFCDLYYGGEAVVFVSMMCMLIEIFSVSIVAPNTTMVVYGILFGGIHSTLKRNLFIQ